MRRILLTVEYFGLNFAGWQRQDNAVSVQQVLEEKLTEVLNEPVKIHGSGRTDRGVHAKGQKAHFDYHGNIPAEKIAFAVNSVLPDDVRIVKSEEADKNLHAQYSAKKKTYEYRLYASKTLSPIRRFTYAQVFYDVDRIDFEKMKRAANCLIGTYDFKGFSSTGSNIKNTVRTIYAADLEKNGDEIVFTITGDGFLYNMVRIIIGTLVEIAVGILPEDAITKTLETGARTCAGTTFPPYGLTLLDVEY
ncbi:MAG TPA: tRNA pseudouridine(38-40) synthase TruA [Clostridia bacterium]|jgi:tRNA pseudouridine38-40 synthase|nr:tRNA pseudouridine(38-40) synthase TruA [Clostridia bacterium]